MAAYALREESSAESLDLLPGMFEPDILVPDSSLRKGSILTEGERALMSALLSDGVQSYILKRISAHSSAASEKTSIFSSSGDTAIARSTAARRRAESEPAVDWVERRDPTYVFSFESVCDSLGLNPNYVRRGIERYIDQYGQSQKSTGANPPELAILPNWKRIRRPRKR